MKKALYLLTILIIFQSCEKQSNTAFDYDYSITQLYEVNEYLVDSIIYFYNGNNQLLKTETYNSKFGYSEEYVNYLDNNIEIGGTNFKLDANKRIVSIGSNQIEYENNKIISEKMFSNDILTQEKIYKYLQEEHYKDSIVDYDLETGQKYITVNTYTYTDTLIPRIMNRLSGLFEYTSPSENLIRLINQEFYDNETKQSDGYQINYAYDISDYKIEQVAICYQGNEPKSLHEINKTTYIKSTR